VQKRLLGHIGAARGVARRYRGRYRPSNQAWSGGTFDGKQHERWTPLVGVVVGVSYVRRLTWGLQTQGRLVFRIEYIGVRARGRGSRRPHPLLPGCDVHACPSIALRDFLRGASCRVFLVVRGVVRSRICTPITLELDRCQPRKPSLYPTRCSLPSAPPLVVRIFS